MSDVSGPGAPGEVSRADPPENAGPSSPKSATGRGAARKPTARGAKPVEGGAGAKPARATSGAARAAAKSTAAKSTAAGAKAGGAKSAKSGKSAAEKPAPRSGAASARAASNRGTTRAAPSRKPAASERPVEPEAVTTEAATLEPDVAKVSEVEVVTKARVETVAEPEDVTPEASEPKAEPVSRAITARTSEDVEPVLVLEGLTKRFGSQIAVDDVTLSLDPGTFTGIVGPNGAGKTTTLSMITGLLRPTSGRVVVSGIDVWRHPQRAKHQLGVLPDRLHTFDRLTGGQLLYYTGVLHGLDRTTARRRTSELAEAFKVEHAMGRLVTDYSSGMLKKIALAAALIHAPRLLVLDEPFESVDPVSAMTVAQILRDFAAGGGTVLMSSHSMELVQRICDHVAVIVDGRLIAGGTVDEVRGDQSLQERFIDLAGADAESIADLTWLRRYSG